MVEELEAKVNKLTFDHEAKDKEINSLRLQILVAPPAHDEPTEK